MKLVVFLVCISPYLVAGDEGANVGDVVNLSEPESKRIVIETKYQFYVRTYNQEVVFDPKAQAYKEFRVGMSPNVAAVNVLSALANGDLDTYKSYMSEGRRRAYEEHGELSTPIKDLLELASSGIRIRLVSRADVGSDRSTGRRRSVIIKYKVMDSTSLEKISQGDLQFSEHLGWRLVDLSSDFLYRHWEFEGNRKVIEMHAEFPDYNND